LLAPIFVYIDRSTMGESSHINKNCPTTKIISIVFVVVGTAYFV
jgi:hypothetical protein